MPTVLRFEGVSKRYGWGTPPVLRDITLAVQQGECVHVAGANGSGKTTLLRVAVGVSRPSGGKVGRARDRSWSPSPPIGGASVSAAALFRAFARERAMPWSVVERLVELLALREHLDHRLGTRSAGTRRKVNVVCGLLVPDPAVIVLDEPWGGLDEASGLALVGELVDRCAHGTTVLLTDHGEAPSLPAGVRHVRLASGTLAST